MNNLLPKDKREWIDFLKSSAFILFGTFVLAFGIAMFIFPFNLVTGGISGIGIILAKSFEEVKFLGDIGPDIYSSIVNWILFALGFFLLGSSFAAKTLISTAFYPLALFISEYIVYNSPISSLLDLTV